MDGREILKSYGETAGVLEPATPEQLLDVEGFVGRFLVGTDVEPLGDSLASWDLANGIQVNVRTTFNHRVEEDEAGELNYSTISYEVNFRRYLDTDKPEEEQDQYAELSYTLLLPTVNSYAAGMVSRTCDVVDLEKVYMFNAAHAQMSREEFDEKLAYSISDFMKSLEDSSEATVADIAMLMDVMTQKTAYNEDPFVLYASGKLQGEIASPTGVLEQLGPLVEEASSQGYVGYERRRKVEVPLDDSEHKATLSVFKSEPEQGPLTNLAQLRDFPVWTIQLVLVQQDNPISEIIRLGKNVSGKVESDHFAMMPNAYAGWRLSQDDPEAYDRYKAAERERLHSKAVKKSMGFDEATASEVNWFQQLVDSVEKQT